MRETILEEELQWHYLTHNLGRVWGYRMFVSNYFSSGS